MRDVENSKRLVNLWLLRYQPNVSDLQLALRDLFHASRNIKDVIKREELLKKKFKNYNSKIYFRQIKAHFSLKIAYMIGSDEASHDTSHQSKAGQKESKQAQIELNRHLHQLQNQFHNVFVVKDIKSNDLIIFMFNPNPRNKGEVLGWYAIANIKRHCLERVVERLGLESIEEALDEIVSSLQWLESSTKELLGRSNLDTFDRHIPTDNGALLLKNYTNKKGIGKSELEGHLITWIHKNQFFKGQKVERYDFNFVQAVNYTLSNPNRSGEIIKIKNTVASLEKELKQGQSIIANINGLNYPYEKYINSLEAGNYLDYIISFNK